MQGVDDKSNAASNKKECDYGERCYRKNPAHFREFEHHHLNNLLEILNSEDEITLPEEYKPKISRQTVTEQLNILRSLNSNSVNQKAKTESNTSKLNGSTSDSNCLSVKPSSTNQEVQSKNNNSEPNGSTRTSRSSLRKRPYTNSGDSKPNNDKNKPLKKRINVNQESVTQYSDSPTVQKLESDQHRDRQNNMSDTPRHLSSVEQQERLRGAQNWSQAMEYIEHVKNQRQTNISDRHKAAAPYYFFLTSVMDSKMTHKEPLSIQMYDILDPVLGDLESSLQINFMVELGWLLAQYHVANQRGKPMTLLYGEMDVDQLSIPFITAVKVKPPSPFGSHHTKMCVLAYKDGSVRMCVHTANLVESDWENRVQGVWLSPRCPPLPLDADSGAGESPTGFKKDLIQYFSAYGLPELQPWVGKLRRADFSHINVCFVASTPGTHKGVDSDKWGHAKLGALLRQHVQLTLKNSVSPSGWQIVTQCSSIGSLGKEPTTWMSGELKHSMSGALGQGLHAPPPIKLVYPSFKNVESSYDGLLGGGCLPYSNRTHEKQPWLNKYLYQWKSDERHRTRAMPHIKTYTRVSPDFLSLAWFHLTSANMSKAAWGARNKSGAITILSYEAGVLFLPKFVLGSSSFPLKETASNSPVFPLPYDLPLTPYLSTDTPWFIDNIS